MSSQKTEMGGEIEGTNLMSKRLKDMSIGTHTETILYW